MRLARTAVLALLAAAGALRADDAAPAVERGLRLLQENRLPEALDALSAVVRAHPDSGAAHAARAQVYSRMGDTDRALADADRAVALAPRDPAAWEARGLVRIARNDWPGVEADFSRALELKPADGRFLAFRGYARARQGRPADAVPDYSKALETMAEDHSVWDFRGEAYRALGQLEPAVADLTRAVRLAPGNPAYREHRGTAYLAAGQPRKAVADFTAALDADGRNPDYWNDRCVAYSRTGQWEYMLRDATKAAALDPANGVYAANRGVALGRLGRPREALDEFGRALKLLPDHPGVRFERGLVLADLADWPAALADFTEVTPRSPGHADAWNRRGVCHLRLEQSDEALAAYTRAVGLAPQAALYRRNRAALRAERREWGPAAEDYAECLKLESAGPSEFSEAALLAARRGDAARCREVARRCRERFAGADDPEAVERVAAASALLPGTAAELAGLRERLTRLTPPPAAKVRFALTAALLALRAGEFDRAAEALEACARDGTPAEQAEALPALALTRHHLGRRDAARQALAQARERLAALDGPPAGTAPAAGIRLTWPERFRRELLLQEAEAALGPAGPGGGTP
jgi:tetratricopeptide (TPR) repeat protein